MLDICKSWTFAMSLADNPLVRVKTWECSLGRVMETSLHRDLKDLYASPGRSQLEVPLGDYRSTW